MTKVSVIIPFYKVEKHIIKCLSSVKEQSFTDFECILIDDESPDNTYELAKNFIGCDKRFKIIRQKNKGLGGARNTGLANACGDYVAFLDSDDYWSPDFLQVMYNNACLYDADIVICRFKAVDDDGNFVNFSQNKTNGVWTKQQQIADKLLDWHIAWDKLYKKSVWQGVLFPNHRYYEDFATIYKLTPNTKKLVAIDDVLYFYLQRQGSITNGVSKRHIEDLFQSLLEINNFYHSPIYSLIDINYRLHCVIMSSQSLTSYRKKQLLEYLINELSDLRPNIGHYMFCDAKKSICLLIYQLLGFSCYNLMWYLRSKV